MKQCMTPCGVHRVTHPSTDSAAPASSSSTTNYLSLGSDMGTRSKRFAMVVEDGIVSHLETDEGIDDDCNNTSARKFVDRDLDSRNGGGGIRVVVRLLLCNEKRSSI
jgi:hypothetical protein